MANTMREWCPACNDYRTFYNVESDVWECDDCGYELGSNSNNEALSDNSYCDECRIYGDDTDIDEEGNIVNRCINCPDNPEMSLACRAKIKQEIVKDLGYKTSAIK